MLTVTTAECFRMVKNKQSNNCLTITRPLSPIQFQPATCWFALIILKNQLNLSNKYCIGNKNSKRWPIRWILRADRVWYPSVGPFQIGLSYGVSLNSKHIGEPRLAKITSSCGWIDPQIHWNRELAQKSGYGYKPRRKGPISPSKRLALYIAESFTGWRSEPSDIRSL